MVLKFDLLSTLFYLNFVSKYYKTFIWYKYFDVFQETAVWLVCTVYFHIIKYLLCKYKNVFEKTFEARNSKATEPPAHHRLGCM